MVKTQSQMLDRCRFESAFIIFQLTLHKPF